MSKNLNFSQRVAQGVLFDFSNSGLTTNEGVARQGRNGSEEFSSMKNEFVKYLEKFHYTRPTKIEPFKINGKTYKKFIGEFWTSRQRQGNSLHEIAYRACFKAELPGFFINNLTKPGDTVYDPFAGRGTTVIEAALAGRSVISNDISPLSKILCRSRLSPPNINELRDRLYSIPTADHKEVGELSPFYHLETEKEILSIRKYLSKRKGSNKEDDLDEWIRMVATNRLTGHSKGYFSVYTLPPNQAVSLASQIKINLKKQQVPEYRNTREIILKKTKTLIKDLDEGKISNLKKAKEGSVFLELDSRMTKDIKSNSVNLTVTSPPFLDIVQYADDNWLRCWFNFIDSQKIASGISTPKKVDDWRVIMGETLKELYRITKPKGFVVFEVGEVRNGRVKLDEEVVPLGECAGFECLGVMINEQVFTKTSNIWGISNNEKGTNTNRIVVLRK